MSHIGSRKRASSAHFSQRRAQVRARLDAVHDVGVALPLDMITAHQVGVEHVAPGLHPVALAVTHEVVDQLLARRR